MPQPRPLEFGEILDGAFALFRRHIATFFLAGLIVMVPMTVISQLTRDAMMEVTMAQDAAMPGPGFLAFFLATFTLWAILFAALVSLTAQAYEGEQPRVGHGYRQALRTLPKQVAVWLIVGILGSLITGVLLALVVVMAGALALAGGLDQMTVGMLGGALGGLVGLASVFVILTSTCFAVQALIIEGLGPWAALRRARRLAARRRGRILGMFLVTYILMALPTLGIMMVAGMGSALYDVEAAVSLSPLQLTIQYVASALTGSLTIPFMAICFTILYFDHRVRSEGYDLEVAADALAANGSA